MLSIEHLRKIDSTLNAVPDEELTKAIEHMTDLAQLAFEVWWKKHDSKNPIKVLHESERKNKI